MAPKSVARSHLAITARARPALVVAERERHAIREERRGDGLSARDPVLLFELLVDHLVVISSGCCRQVAIEVEDTTVLELRQLASSVEPIQGSRQSLLARAVTSALSQ